MEIGQRFIELRKQKNLTQEDISQQLNLTRSAISLWESNKRKPDADTLVQLADFYDVSVDYLLCRENSCQTIYPDSAYALTTKEKNLLSTFKQLNKDNQDIVIGKTKDLLREQIHDQQQKEQIPLKKVK